jgi:hypothetical protein
VVCKVNVDPEGDPEWPMDLKVTMLIKRDNRRKHNGHDWFLRSFAPAYTTGWNNSGVFQADAAVPEMKLCLMTDAGTNFEATCLLRLVQYMIETPACVACSGRQRVMSAEMQDEGNVERSSFQALRHWISHLALFDSKKRFSLSHWRGALYRAAQGFEYEASISSFSGAFHFTGMLPVLPGPCQLVRLDLVHTVSLSANSETETRQTWSMSSLYSLCLCPLCSVAVPSP